MNDINFPERLGEAWTQYKAVQKLCGASQAGHVFGEALDAAAGTLAVHLAAITDEEGLTTALQPWLFEDCVRRYGQGRDSVALAPVLSLIEVGAPPEAVAKALLERSRDNPTDDIDTPQTLDQAEDELTQLIELTGEGGIWGDVYFEARDCGQWIYDQKVAAS